MGLFATIFNRLKGGSVHPFNGIHSPEEFRLILERERARADRSGDKFSLVVFDLGNTNDRNGSSLAVEHLTRALFKRVRLTDTVGWFDETSIGTVLPGTTGQGAWKFADDVRKKAVAVASQFSYRVYTYPMEGTADEKGVFDRPRRQEVSHRYDQVSFEGFFIRNPVPSSRGYISPIPLRSAVPFRSAQKTIENGEALFARPMPLWKRGVDLLGATVGLILFSPLMLAISIAIKLTSPGPIIFKQMRAGLGGEPFVFYKFRTMINGAEQLKKDLLPKNEQTGPVFKIKNDPRVTSVGRFLRKTSMDELPQFWNVLKGDMSLVGPRPPTLDEVPQYETWQNRRLDVTPGITCIWQMSGRNEIGFRDWMRMDIRYIRRVKFFRDLRILLQTLSSVLLRKGAR